MADVAILKTSAARPASNDPWSRARRPGMEPEAQENISNFKAEQNGITSTGQAPEASIPLRTLQFPLRMLGPLGCIAFKDKTMFDSRLMLDASYKYNGINGGMAWKSKVERYFVTQAPCFRELLE